jgi:hypothetical protein
MAERIDGRLLLAAALVTLVAAAVLFAGGESSPRHASAAPAPASAAAPATSAPRPEIVKRLIPYGKSRRRDMAAYSKRHYGHYKWRLGAPKLVVEHYAVAGSISAIYNTFAPNNPDVEFHELPGVCSHYAIGSDGTIVKFVPVNIRCRHVVGLNHVAIGIEHVGFSDADILNRPAQLNASLRLTDWLRCRFGFGVKRVIGHNESLSSPFFRELDPDFRGQTHGDFNQASMRIYRGELRSRAAC